MADDSPEPRGVIYVLLYAFGFLSGWFSAERRAPVGDISGTVERGPIARGVGDPSQIKPAPFQQEAAAQTESRQSDGRKYAVPVWGKRIAEWSVAAGTVGLLIMNIVLLKATNRNLRITQRAWMIPASPEMKDFEAGKMAKLIVPVWNNGATPATEAVIDGGLRYWHSGEPIPPLDVSAVRPTEWKKGSLVRSGGAIKITLSSVKIDDDTLRDLHSGRLNIRAYGEVFYDDIFERHHWVTYCFGYNEETGNFVACDEGTHMDPDQE
jgi:hypothetical protein